MSLRDVMDTTKISRRNLSALEEGQVKLLPHPVYLKGYIRNYARLLDLDADRLACIVDQQCAEDMESYLPQEPTAQPVVADEEYHQAAPAPEEHSATLSTDQGKPEGGAEPERRSTAPATSPFMAPDDQPKTYGSDPLVPEKPRGGGMIRTFLVLVALVTVLGGLLYYYQISYKAPEEVKPAPAVEPAPLPAPPLADNASEELNATAAEAMPAPEPQPAPQGAPGAALPASRTSGLGEPAVAPAQPAAPAALGSIVVEKPKAAAAATAAQAAKPAAVPAAAPTAGMQELTIVAKPGETCWVQFNDGVRSKNFTLQPGEVRKMEFAKYARVRLGNAGGVSFSVNGQPHPYQGQRGSIDVVEFGSR